MEAAKQTILGEKGRAKDNGYISGSEVRVTLKLRSEYFLKICAKLAETHRTNESSCNLRVFTDSYTQKQSFLHVYTLYELQYIIQQLLVKGHKSVWESEPHSKKVDLNMMHNKQQIHTKEMSGSCYSLIICVLICVTPTGLQCLSECVIALWRSCVV